MSSVSKSVVVAMYGFDDDALAAMLDTAFRTRRSTSRSPWTPSQAAGIHEKDLLANYSHEMNGNSVAIGNSERGAIMHRKMVIVDGFWRISGSTTGPPPEKPARQRTHHRPRCHGLRRGPPNPGYRTRLRLKQMAANTHTLTWFRPGFTLDHEEPASVALMACSASAVRLMAK